jgi:transitional endoplasmic reticulum ATPase
LRRPGRFDREIEIGVPAEPDRVDILKIHTRGMPLADDVSLDVLAQQTHGFVGADLAALAREAAIRALRRYLPSLDLDAKEIPQEVLDTLRVLAADFRSAQRDVGPSAMREVMLEVSHVKWSDVGGLEEAKTEIREAIELPLTDRQKFEDLGIEPPQGVLLYGPPGTGKTLIAKAVAHEAKATFIRMSGSELVHKFIGEGAGLVRELFMLARERAPAIVFIDEIDAVGSMRTNDGTSGSAEVQRTMMQLLAEMDGFDNRGDVRIMAATNRVDMLDPALLRPGRFDRIIEIPLPDAAGRLEILKIHSRKMQLAGVDLNEITAMTEKATGAELQAVCREAGMIAVRRDAAAVERRDFVDAVHKVKNEKVMDNRMYT